MKIVTDNFLIKRNQRIGQISTIGSLVVLVIGLFLSFQNQLYINFSFLALLVGFILSQVSIYYGNRYGGRPRLDEQLDVGLKGLDDKYTIYHYVLAVPHLLVGPAGIWILLPYTQGGTITFQKGRWHQRGGNIYLKYFAQGGISRPDLDIEVNTEKIQKILTRQLPGYTLPPIQAVLVFTNEKAVISCDDAPSPTIPVNKLKEFLRKKAKADPLEIVVVSHITEALPYI